MNTNKCLFSVGLLFALFGSLLLGLLVGCDNKGDRPNSVNDIENDVGTHEVTTECYFMNDDGSLISFDSTSLRASDDSNVKGSITGGGSFQHGDKTIIKATANSGYQLYTLYERDAKEGYTKEKGEAYSEDKSIEVVVNQDLHFIAIFFNPNSKTALEYRNLKISNIDKINEEFASKDPKDKLVISESDINNYEISVGSNGSGFFRFEFVGEEWRGLFDYYGNVRDWELSNREYKEWTFDGDQNSYPWIKISLNYIESIGWLYIYSIEKHVDPSGKPRVATFRVGRDGTNGGKGAWRTITITQKAHIPNEDWRFDGFYLGDRQIYSYLQSSDEPTVTFMPEGNSIDVLSLIPKVELQYKKYVDGSPTVETRREPATPTFSDGPSWTKRNGSTYTAEKNATGSSRDGSAAVSWKHEDKSVTCDIKFSQDRIPSVETERFEGYYVGNNEFFGKNAVITFDPKGSSVDAAKDLPRVVAVYGKYVDGVRAGESRRVDVTPTFSDGPSWTTRSGSIYKARKNTGSSRRGTAAVSWQVSGERELTASVIFSQGSYSGDGDGVDVGTE